jgi:hypothetical protein
MPKPFGESIAVRSRRDYLPVPPRLWSMRATLSTGTIVTAGVRSTNPAARVKKRVLRSRADQRHRRVERAAQPLPFASSTRTRRVFPTLDAFGP